MDKKPKSKANVKLDEKFQKAVQILANTPPISNKELTKRSKNRKK